LEGIGKLAMAELERVDGQETYLIPVDEILVDSDFNCRRVFTPQSVKELADSIESAGQLFFPITVQPIEDAGITSPGYRWRLIAGHRRYTAVTTFLKWGKINATIRRGLSSHEAQLLNLTENLERSQLNPLEEALSIERVFPKNTPARVIGKLLNRNSGWVKQRLNILGLPAVLKERVAAGRLSLGDVDQIVQAPDENRQIKLADDLEKAKCGPTRRRVRFIGDTHVRGLARRRTNTEVNAMISTMLSLGVTGLAPKFGAWCVGYITEQELEAEIFKEIGNQRARRL
jgi:ParB/RepB/Spo0J family partition protein